jgi:F-type H+-transporting ATPase subunit delta
MRYDAIARRWARAIFEIGKETGSVTRLEADVSAFAATYTDNEELATVLDNPLLPEASREAVIVEISTRMGLSDTARSTLRLLARKRRVAALPDIARQLARLADEDQDIVRADVQSAGPLSDDYLAKLRAELERATGKKVTISHRQDPALIGGVVTKIGDRVIDGSVRARLTGFRESLLR